MKRQMPYETKKEAIPWAGQGGKSIKQKTIHHLSIAPSQKLWMP